jgi:hypothetical protein
LDFLGRGMDGDNVSQSLFFFFFFVTYHLLSFDYM